MMIIGCMIDILEVFDEGQVDYLLLKFFIRWDNF